MSKAFSITYAPRQWGNSATGSLHAPYGGLDVQAPEDQLDPRYSPALNNVLLRNSELRSRPNLTKFLPGPDGQNPVLAVGSFLSPNLVYHTFAFTTRGMFQLTANSLTFVARGQNPWSFIGGPLLQSGVPVAWQSLSSILYYTNGMHISAWDGVQNNPLTDVAFLGVTNPPPVAATVIGSIFLGELDSHIILAYVNETTNGVTIAYPARIRWSNSGFNPISGGGVFGGNLGTIGATFDPTINVNSGLNDFIDVPDIITGTMFLGRVGYIFRQNGITEVSPTGRGIAPFDFNHLWASYRGIGNVYPFSIAQYGSNGVFISTEQIYQISTTQLQPIGGGARDAIMADLAAATNSPKASIVPSFDTKTVYMQYELRIPVSDHTITYIYSFEDQNWTRWTFSGLLPAGKSGVCWI